MHGNMEPSESMSHHREGHSVRSEMKRTRPTAAAAAAVTFLSIVGGVVPGDGAPIQGPGPVDSARTELRLGRFWHAARLLRSAGVDQDPEKALLLARAEAGWENWDEVAGLLEDAEWLADEASGEAWFLLGRAREEAGRWGEAALAYEGALATALVGLERDMVRGRLARARAREGNAIGALDALDGLSPIGIVLASWVVLEMASSAAEGGDTAQVAALIPRILDSEARERSWRLLPQARLAAGDSVGAEADYRVAAGSGSAQRRAEAGLEVGRLALARGDSAAARPLLLAALEVQSLRLRARAAADLMAIGDTDLSLTLRLARIFDRAGDGGRALLAYDRAATLTEELGRTLAGPSRLARARLMGTVVRRQDEALEEHRAIRAETEDRALAARNLEVWAQLRRRQGRSTEVNTLRRWLVEEYPESSEAAEVVWARGFDAESRGSVAAALGHYADVARNAPTHARAGQARMRIGQIRIEQGRLEEAADVFQDYLSDFPNGRRWEEASFWGAWAALKTGDRERADRFVERILRDSPVSYYAVVGSQLLGRRFEVKARPGPSPVEAGWLTEGLRRMDLLDATGLDRGAGAEEARLVAKADPSADLTLSLAEALIRRGRTVTGINLGWDLVARGSPWSRRLLEVLYPFPYRDLVRREAEEWGVDPVTLAAIIRQESAFKADIVSHAGAVGLMQVLPPTGRELARAHGPDRFQETSLTTPEVNLHLGAAFFVEMRRRFGELPLVLSAYNAGPTRANRWRRYPEASDPLRFTERIPFEETRGYVKNVRRNVGIYQALYGQD